VSGPVYDGVAGPALSARLRTPSLVLAEHVTSTLDELHRLAAQGAPAGTAVLADRQSRGRGRHGRTWESPAGRGIWLAWLARPAEPETGVLSLRAGLAVIAAAETLGARPRLKWPNDVMLGDRKLAGVLCEARWDGGRPAWVAVGIGINVHGPVPEALARSAVALDAEVPATRVDVLAQLLPALHAMPGGRELTATERHSLSERDWLQGRRLTEPSGGVAAGIDATGALLVDAPDGRMRVMSGTVRVAGETPGRPDA
jgi:BirA family biotin operon repressor/biotin-[acetyl-CoA-carboxylase] ligase